MNCKNFFVNILKKVIKKIKVFRSEIQIIIKSCSNFINK